MTRNGITTPAHRATIKATWISASPWKVERLEGPEGCQWWTWSRDDESMLTCGDRAPLAVGTLDELGWLCAEHWLEVKAKNLTADIL